MSLIDILSFVVSNYVIFFSCKLLLIKFLTSSWSYEDLAIWFLICCLWGWGLIVTDLSFLSFLFL